MNVRDRRSTRYGLTVCIVLASLLLRWLLVPVIGSGTLYITVYPAIMIAAVLFGGGPAIFGAVLSLVLLEFSLGEPLNQLTWSLSLAVRSSILLFTSAYVGYFSQKLRENEKRLSMARVEIARAQAVESERKRLYEVLETLPVYVVLLTPDYRVAFANRFFRERFGEDQGRRCHDYLFNLPEPCENCETYKVLKTDGPHHWEWLGPDGHNYDIHDFPFKNADGSTYVMEVGIDISDRKRAQEALSAAQKEVEKEKRLSDIGTLAAIVAHELRNPLASIKMAAYNIEKKAQNPKLSSHLVNIEKKIEESEQIINNLLFYSRLKAPTFERADIYEVIDECVSHAEMQFSKEKIAVRKDFEVLKNTVIDADIVQMRELFSNVLNNAFEAFLGKAGLVEIAGRQTDDGHIKVSIRDNGPGIDEENLKKVTAPFFSTKAKGTGLGLTVSSQIVDLHNGKLEIESRKDEGTTMTVTLPIKK